MFWQRSYYVFVVLPFLAAPVPGVAAPQLVVEPDAVVVGDPVTIRVTGLEPNRVVLLQSERYSERRDAIYRGAAAFRADRDGVVDLSEDAPIAAGWTGVDPRGLFWTAIQTEEKPAIPTSWHTARIAADVDADGTYDLEATIDLASGMDALVEIPLGEEFPGAFLLRPPGSEPLSAIIALGGSEGNDSAVRSIAPKLASRGYAVLGLPYYSPAWGNQEQKFPELPRAFHEIPLDRLEEARDWLRARPDVDGSRIAVYGVSKGAEFALAGAARIDGFAAVAAIAPTDLVWEGWGAGAQGSCFSWRGEPLPFVPYLGMGQEFTKAARDQAVRLRLPHDAGRLAHPDHVEAARIRVEDVTVPVFVVGGDQDDVWDSGGMARNITEIRRRTGLETVLIVDKEAGHQLSGDGYSPARPDDARVQGEAYPALIEFFERHLGKAQ